MVAIILRIEQLVIFGLVLFLFGLLGFNWWWFLLWIVPDLGMIGYLKNKRIGAITYNLTHNYLYCFGILVFAYLLNNDVALAIGLVFCSHISLDRFLGYGLKYKSNFKDTHLQKL